MVRDFIDSMRLDRGQRTLGELLQERQWAVDEISRLRCEVTRLTSRRLDPVQRANPEQTPTARDSVDPLTSRRLLRLAEVESLVAVRWRAADILAWQDQATG
jgi:hypothetical protein